MRLRFYSEKKFAAGLGLSREKLREIRTVALALREPEHFAHAGREIAYTASGAARILEYLRASGAGDMPEDLEEFSSGSDQDPPEPDTPVTLRITHVCRNRHLVDAADGSGKAFRVWVSDNRKFMQGMDLKAKPREGSESENFYELVGRLPHRRGRY